MASSRTAPDPVSTLQPGPGWPSLLDILLFAVVTLAAVFVFGLLAYSLYFQMHTYSTAIQRAISDSSKGDVVVLAFSRAIDFAIVKTSALFLGFILAFLGALYVLRTGSVSFALQAHSGSSGGSIKTSSPGLVMISLGILTVALALFDHTSVKIDSKTPASGLSDASSQDRDDVGRARSDFGDLKDPIASLPPAGRPKDSPSGFPAFQRRSAELSDAQRAYLRRIAGRLASDPSLAISLGNVANDYDSTEENLVLGERRADAIKSFLASVAPSVGSQITVFSNGKEPTLFQRKGGMFKVKTQGK